VTAVAVALAWWWWWWRRWWWSSRLLVPDAVAFLELALLGVAGGDVCGLGRSQLQTTLGIDDSARRALQPALRVDTQPSAGSPDHQDGPAKLDAHSGGHAPRVLLDERPSHDLVEDRETIPPWMRPPSPRSVRQGQFHAAAGRRELELQMQAELVELAAGEAVVRQDAKVAVREECRPVRGAPGRAGASVRASSVAAVSDIEVLDLSGLGLDEILARLDALPISIVKMASASAASSTSARRSVRLSGFIVVSQS